MKVVVLTGPESVGKSTLCKALAQHYQAPLVGEYVREYAEQLPRDTIYSDVTLIAQQQLQNEQAARALRPPLLLLDTHLLSNMVWSQTLFHAVPSWLEPTLLAQQYDLVALLSPEGMVWEADNVRCHPTLAERRHFYRQLEQWLVAHQQPLLTVHGTWAERFTQLVHTIDALLAQNENA